MITTLRRTAWCGTTVLLLVTAAFSYDGGAPDGYAGNPPDSHSCVECHNAHPVNAEGACDLFLLPEAYAPGRLRVLQVIVSNPGHDRWGFQLAALDSNGNQAGYLLPIDTSTTWTSDNPGNEPDYLNQTATGSVSPYTFGFWNFSWIAPPTGTGPVTFYLAAVAADGDGSTARDYAYTRVHAVPPQAGGEGPVLAIADGAHYFGNTPLGVGRTWNLPVYSTGTETLVVSSMTLPPGSPFHVTGTLDSLAPGTVDSVSILFYPQDTQWAGDSLLIESNDAAHPVAHVLLSGSGLIPQPPSDFDLLWPRDGATATSDPVTFRWNRSYNRDSTDTRVEYVFELDSESDFLTARYFPTGEETELALPASELTDSRYHFWRVHALDTNTPGTYSRGTYFLISDFSGIGPDSSIALAGGYALRSVYPNPFNSEVRIRLATPREGRLRAVLYDVLGREVAVLHEGRLSAGDHTLSWRGNGSSGVYLLRLEGGNGWSATRKLVYLR